MTAVITYCSKKKAEEATALLPAIRRYAGSHIRRVQDFAMEQGMPLFFLSGFYGIIPANKPITYYEHQLLPNAVTPEFIKKITDQMLAERIDGAYYVSEWTENTSPYDDAMKHAAEFLHAFDLRSAMPRQPFTLCEYNLAAMKGKG